MLCFEKLTRSNFLSNVRNELQKAQYILHEFDTIMNTTQPIHICGKEAAKGLYYRICHEIGFFNELYEADPKYKGIYYSYSDRFVFMFSRSKKIINEELQYTFTLNGYIPIYRKTHYINGKQFHTILFDLEFTNPPITLN
jgi:hypothetical protein